jgi:hypothetical protein
VPKPEAAEATNKRHVLLILTPFNQRADTQCNAQPQANRSPKLVTAGAIRFAARPQEALQLRHSA